MALQITWNDGTNAPTTFTFSDAVIESLELYRQTFVTRDVNTGLNVPSFVDLKGFIVAMLIQRVLVQALEQFPTPEVATARAALAVADAAVTVAKATAIQQAVQ